MKARADAFSGRNPKIYTGISNDIKEIVRVGADKSYTDSPAKEMLIKSADFWQFMGELRQLDLMSTDYANFRQYGCGGLPIVKILVIGQPEIDRFTKRFTEAFVPK